MNITRYHDFFHIDEKHILYNLLSASIIELDDDTYHRLVSSDGNNLEQMLSDDEISVLSENGFLIDSKQAERDARLSYGRTKYSDWSTLKIDILITDACNFACPYCFESENRRSDCKKISTKAIQSFFDKLIKYLSDKVKDQTEKVQIVWYGGEPLLEKNTVLKYANSLSVFLNEKHVVCEHIIITNGFLITEGFLQAFKALQVSFIQITLDGSRDYHNQTRTFLDKRDTYSAIMKNILLCLKHGYEVVIRININRNNIVSIDELLDDLDKTIPYDYRGRSLFVELARIFDAEDSFDYLEYERAIRPLAIRAASLGLMMPKVISSKLTAFCSAECDNSNLVVDYRGDYYTCWNYVFNRNKVSGNIDSLLQGGHPLSDVELEFIEGLSLYAVNDGKCLACKYASCCLGMCPYERKQIRDSGEAGLFYGDLCRTIIHEKLQTAIESYYAAIENNIPMPQLLHDEENVCR